MSDIPGEDDSDATEVDSDATELLTPMSALSFDFE